MKRTIAFVFLGLLIYAGVYVIIYGVQSLIIQTNIPHSLDGYFHSGMTVEGDIDHSYGFLDSRDVQPTMFGIPIGKKIVQELYVIPVGDAPDYMLMAVSDPEDINGVLNASFESFHFTGIAYQMDRTYLSLLKSYLKDNPWLIDADTLPYGIDIVALNRINPYIITVCEIGKPDHMPLIAGIAMCVVGAGLAALLTVRIVREKTGY